MYPFNLSREAVKKILAKSLELSEATERGEIWSSLAESVGSADYEGREIEEPIELELGEEASFREDFIVFCRRKDGVVYSVSPEEYAVSQGGEEEEAEGLKEIGEAYIPEDICGEDEFLGDAHTHPHYPISPSGGDIEFNFRKKAKVMCISSKDTFACVFGEPEEIARVPHRGPTYGNGELCFTAEVVKEDPMGNIVREEYEVCPREYIEGHDEAWVNEVRKMVRDGRLQGMCFKSPQHLFGDRIVCEFRVGDKTRMEEFHVKELEKI